MVIQNLLPNCTTNIFFQNSSLDWKTLYVLPRIVTKDSRLRVFQCKLLNNVFYLNKIHLRFGKIDSPLCLSLFLNFIYI